MTKFDNLVKAIENKGGNYKTATIHLEKLLRDQKLLPELPVKKPKESTIHLTDAEIAKILVKEFNTITDEDTVEDNQNLLQDKNTNQNLLQYAIEKNNLELLEFILRLLNPGGMEFIFFSGLLKAIKKGNVEAIQLIDKLIPQCWATNKEIFKKYVLRFGNYHLINKYFEHEIDFNSHNDALDIIQNQHDLSFLLRKFPPKILKEVEDVNKNNILHLALKSKNKNIFQYVINHLGNELLYKENQAGDTPISIIYKEIKELSQENPDNLVDFSKLMLLDQVGADLETQEFFDIYKAYQDLPEHQRKFILAKQGKQVKITGVGFNGGGTKGQAFGAALAEAEKYGLIDLKEIKRVCGTSAGAITAFLLALGYDSDRFIKEMNEFDFKKMMEKATTPELQTVMTKHAKVWMEYYSQGAYKTLIFSIITTLLNENINWWNSASLTTSINQLLTNTTGIFDPTYLEDTLKRLLKERTKGTDLENIPPECITFEDFAKHPDIFKELIVYGTNLTQGCTERYSVGTDPKMSPIKTVMTSAAFPFFFENQKKYIVETDENGVRTLKEVLFNGKPILCCDGGVLKNDPVNACDNGEFNENQLTFLLINSEGKKRFEQEHKEHYTEIKSMTNVLSQLWALMSDIERNVIHEDIRNPSRIFYIDTADAETLGFANADKTRPKLHRAGQEAVIDFLNRRIANDYSKLRPEMIALLMSFGIARTPITGAGQAVEIALGRKLSPLQILRIYAAAKDDEINLLRSIINPNQRDKNGVTALSIARQFKFDGIVQRLLKAGANPAVQTIEIKDVPIYFTAGNEGILTNCIPDAQLERIYKLENEIKKLENQIRQLSLQQVNIDSKENREKKPPSNEKVAEMKSHEDLVKQAQLEENLALVQQKMAAQEELLKALQLQNDKLKSNLAEANTTIIALQEKLKEVVEKENAKSFVADPGISLQLPEESLLLDVNQTTESNVEQLQSVWGKMKIDMAAYAKRTEEAKRNYEEKLTQANLENAKLKERLEKNKAKDQLLKDDLEKIIRERNTAKDKLEKLTQDLKALMQSLGVRTKEREVANERVGKLQEELKNFKKDPNRSLDEKAQALKAARENSEKIKTAVKALVTHRDKLQKQIDSINSALKKSSKTASRWQRRKIDVRQAKVDGINEILKGIQNPNQYVEVVVERVKKQHSLFYAGFFNSRTKNRCINLVKAEAAAKKGLGI